VVKKRADKKQIKRVDNKLTLITREQTMVLIADLIIDSFLELRNKKKDGIVKTSST
jgi:hypothetical protein